MRKNKLRISVTNVKNTPQVTAANKNELRHPRNFIVLKTRTRRMNEETGIIASTLDS
jgi:hypothetical protein